MLAFVAAQMASCGPLATLSEPTTLRIPAFAAYFEPDPDRGPHREDDGRLTCWRPDTHLVWYAHLATGGDLDLSLELAGALAEPLTLRLSCAAQEGTAVPQSFEVHVAAGAHEAPLAFGHATIAHAGYERFTLECLDANARALPGIRALVLGAGAAAGAHASTVERRNAASVHLGYPVPPEARDEIEWFYLELEPRTDPLYTYYEATGFDRGYFGMQVNGPNERRLIFSVWDAGTEAKDRSKVAPEDRVELLAKGTDVVASDFGNEGTGGHSHLVYPWVLGQRYRFLLHAEAAAGEHPSTTYTAWFFFPERARWDLVASFRAPRDGHFLRGLYSFNENFGGANGDRQRVCSFGNGWVRTRTGRWIALQEARFTHDGHGKDERLDRSAGVRDGRFYLANGGFVEERTSGAVTRAGEVLELERPAGEHPADLELPALPAERPR